MCYTSIEEKGKSILTLEEPLRKVALWHVTKKCNMECKYCYGTFNGSSYKSNNSESKNIHIEKMVKAVDFLNEMGVSRIHLCGGEPFLYPDFEKLLTYINQCKIESFVLSNLTFLPQYIEKLFKHNIIKNLSFSLDSLDENYNIYIRGNHYRVINNIEKVLQYKRKYHSCIEIGLYAVATKKNLGLLKNMVEWALSKGIDYITLQAVYLPKTHEYYDELVITSEELDDLNKLFDYLTDCSNKIRVSGELLQFITNALIHKDKLCVRNCFVEHNSNYFFLDGDGNIKTCTNKNNVIGNICNEEFPTIRQTLGENKCTEFCLDCIGIWEMVYPEDVNRFIKPVI